MVILTEERIDAVRRAIPALDEDPTVNCYWVTGSVTAGLGTPASDLDVTVVTSDDPGRVPGGIRRGQYWVDSRRVDVNVQPVAWLRQLVDSVGSYVACSMDTGQLYTPEPVLKAVAQLHAGVRIVKDSTEFAGVRSALHRGEIDFRRLLIARAAMCSHNTQEDLAGFIADGDFDSAVLRARDLLMFGLDAWTVACGEPYPGNKWLWRRLNRVLTDADALSFIRDMLLPGSAVAASDFSYLHRVNTLNQTLLTQALLRCWSVKPREAADPVIPDMAADGVWRTPGWSLNRTVDQWCLGDRRSAFATPVTAAICWAFANGLPPEVLVETVIERSATWFEIKITQVTAVSLVTKLTEIGAVAVGHLTAVADQFYAHDAA